MKSAAVLLLTAVLVLTAVTLGHSTSVQAANSSQAAACGASYTVQSGDYLSLIASNCGVAYADLLNANPNITNPDVISAGQVINIPASTGIPATGSNTATPAATGSAVTTTPTAQATASSSSTSGSTTANSTTTATPAATGSATAAGSSSATATPAANIPNTGNTSAAAAGGRTYTVQSGDSLSSIAQSYNISLTDLLNANPAITDADTIYTNQQITLPSNASATPNATNNSTSTADNGSSVLIPNTGGTGSTYTVQTGDTLGAIAMQYNTTVTNLVNANTDITNPDLIFPGQVLNIR